MTDIQGEYDALKSEVILASASNDELQVTEFFKIFSELSAEAGDSPDMEYLPFLVEGAQGYRIDGFALDVVEGEVNSIGELFLAVCDYRNDEDIPSITAADVEKVVKSCERFYKQISKNDFLEKAEETSHIFQLAILINQHRHRIKRIRIILLTNAVLKTRKTSFEERYIGEISVHINVFDFARYQKISTNGADPIEIDFAEDFGGAIHCLPAFTGDGAYESYLLSVPGTILANIFSQYGNRLLEKNVRTYLQAKTAVNKGILKTIENEPFMFFAYNNGITATASDVDIVKDHEFLGIKKISNLQIVNGGQTTASLLYAKDINHRSLEKVYVQMKLSVISEDKIADVVPKISEYANTQNKVSISDLASNSPAQLKIEKLSKQTNVPVKRGALVVERWFYERSRGQYKSMFAYKSQSDRKKLELEFPKSNVITKTDLAKYELTFSCQPFIVSQGAQKCFSKYISLLKKQWDEDENSINEEWFKCAVAKTILFKTLDSRISKSEWYKSDKGYKAQILTYTLACAVNAFSMHSQFIDYFKIWNTQSVDERFIEWLLGVAESISSLLQSPPPEVKNISEYAKKQLCWEVLRQKNTCTRDFASRHGVEVAEYKDEMRAGKKSAAVDSELEFEMSLLKLDAGKIQSMAIEKGLASPKNTSALEKLKRKDINLNKSEKNALKNLLDRLNS